MHAPVLSRSTQAHTEARTSTLTPASTCAQVFSLQCTEKSCTFHSFRLRSMFYERDEGHRAVVLFNTSPYSRCSPHQLPWTLSPLTFDLWALSGSCSGTLSCAVVSWKGRWGATLEKNWNKWVCVRLETSDKKSFSLLREKVFSSH